ncbi:fimbria/pilus outer membrane usher protein [Variovorax sp. YR216]|uniref:fimbria/pilus outer membrane usher protein n=1 Tax=Variovorax sp. YR216 TaxID=1882828 RepID=UPI000895A6C0|nr:fimbria/pilus outer membrane usher protein [Variovorax sp. YR216]SEA02057.1 outer membrane usher protein [Variovorax sp. YR216]
MRALPAIFFGSAVGTALFSSSARAAEPEAPAAYQFDSRFLLGSSLGAGDIERFNRAQTVDPGVYQVDVFVNGVFRSRKNVEFRAQGNEVAPCLETSFLLAAGVLPSSFSAPAQGAADDASQTCRPLGSIAGARTSFDLPRLRLDVSIPQALMKRTIRGAVDRADIDPGVTAGFLNYDANYFRASSQGTSNESMFLGMNFGANLGMWRFRQQSSYSYFAGRDTSEGHWNSIRAYAQRALPDWGSELTIGQSFTTGRLFSTVGFEGVQVATDERMLPDSQRGFAPVVRGVASTNARVTVRQAGNEIYQTTVAPGPFSIEDLYPTSFQGDLQVTVTEADGRVSTFTVPFAAVPGSMRPGSSRYAATVGRVRNIEDSRAVFGEGVYQHGLSNELTANLGVRGASDYQALLGGVVWGTSFGALGSDATYAVSKSPSGDGNLTGWRIGVSYSQSFQPMGTSFALTGYNYSQGYREMSDALASLAAQPNLTILQSTTYLLRNQIVANVNQSLGSFGQLFLTASVSDYHGGLKDRDTQFQLSYSNVYRSVSYGVNITRQRTGALFGTDRAATAFPNNAPPAVLAIDSRLVNVVMFTVSIPLGSGPRTASASASVVRRSGGGTSYQTSVSGVADEAQTLSYGISATHDAYDGAESGGTSSSATSVSGNLQKRLSIASVGASYSRGSGFWQAGASERGALVAHAGGLTPGPYLSETFGVVEAPGASGATVRNGLGARVDGAGFAVIPSLAPYRYNDVGLDTQGINRNAELDGSLQRTAPSAGAAVHLKFATRIGYALLARVGTESGKPLPLGAPVTGSDGVSVGMVGQGGQVYARVGEAQGVLTVKWGDAPSERCDFPFSIDPKADELLHRFEATCRSAGP